MSNASADTVIPIVVLTGFLGSGKTTLLNRLIKNPNAADTAVLVNELGEIGIDHALIESVNDDLVLLESGCLCCTVRGDLVRSLHRLYARIRDGRAASIRRVIIETSGLADPAPILHTLSTDPLLSARFRLAAVLTTVDAVNGSHTLDRHLEARKQIAVADRLIVTKSDIADMSLTRALVRRVRQLNPAATLDFAADRRAINSLLSNLVDPAPLESRTDIRLWLRAEAYNPVHDAAHHERHDQRVRSFCVWYDQAFSWDSAATWLDHLATQRGESLLRVKGMLNVAGIDGPLIIQGVQHLIHPPRRLKTWPDADRRSRVVFITQDLDRAQIEQCLRDALAARTVHGETV